MNTNLLNIVKRIIAEQGEDILSNPQRLKAFFMDYAKDEPKSERVAFGRCVEMGCYAELKGCGNVEERLFKKPKLTDQLHRTTGIDRVQCADAIDLLEAAVFGAVSMAEKEICQNCGKELQTGWKSCPFCVAATADTAGDQRKDKAQYYLSYNYKETGPYDKTAIKAMAANGQITADYFVRADNGTAEWKAITTFCAFPSGGASHSVNEAKSPAQKKQQKVPETEDGKNKDVAPPAPEKKLRHGFTSFWLWTSLVVWVGIFGFFIIGGFVSLDEGDDVYGLIIAAGGALGAGITVSGLWAIIKRWRRGGFGKIVAGSIISVLIPSYAWITDVGVDEIVIGFGIGLVVLLVITRAILGLKNTHDEKSTWEQLDK